MKSRVRAFGHPVHPMLVMFPIALFVTGFVFDAIQFFSNNGTFSQVGFWCITAGLIGAVLAAATGVADWTRVPAGNASEVGRPAARAPQFSCGCGLSGQLDHPHRPRQPRAECGPARP